MIIPQHKYWPYIFLFAGTIILDRLTKYWILANPRPKSLTSWLSFELQYNRGISWGIFNDGGQAAFIILTVMISFFLIGLALYTWARWLNYFPIYGEALIIGGALSNLFDRIFYGGVIDFIVLSYEGWSWPIFNCADAAIVIGVGLMLLQQCRKS
jgi:lipoprotein signal peptidase